MGHGTSGAQSYIGWDKRYAKRRWLGYDILIPKTTLLYSVVDGLLRKMQENAAGGCSEGEKFPFLKK
jgi:hypothetical protein